MAMLFNYSFNNIDTAALPGALASINGSPTVGSADGPQGINTLHCDGTGNFGFLPNVSIPINSQGLVVGAGFNITGGFGPNPTICFCIGGAGLNDAILVGINPDGSIAFGTARGTIFASPSGTFTFGNRHEVEVEISSFASSNSSSVSLDGVAVFGLTGKTLGNLTGLGDGSTVHTVCVGGTSVSATVSGTTVVVDSTYTLDTTGSSPCNAPLGPAISVPMIPNAPGQESAWTPNGASLGWECISEIPPDGDTTYISDATPNDEESVSLTTPMGIIGVYAVSVIADQRQDSAGGGRTVALGVGNGTTRSYGTPWGLGTTYKMNTTSFSFNPFTSSPWALADMTALEAAAKLSS